MSRNDNGKLPGRSSRMSGFYRLPLAERRAQLSAAMGTPGSDLACLDDGGLDLDAANDLIENVIGTYSLPLGLGLNFVVNGRDYLVPMCVEEPSVVAAASNAARMVRSGGGFKAEADPPIMIAQVELRDVPDLGRAEAAIAAATPRLLAEADLVIGKLVERGGGARALVPRRPRPRSRSTADGSGHSARHRRGRRPRCRASRCRWPGPRRRRRS